MFTSIYFNHVFILLQDRLSIDDFRLKQFIEHSQALFYEVKKCIEEKDLEHIYFLMGSSTMTAKEVYHIQIQNDDDGHRYKNTSITTEYIANMIRSLMRALILQLSPILPLNSLSKRKKKVLPPPIQKRVRVLLYQIRPL
jgi:hypothetical protein